jgi:iron(III) transport system substrate-binding protein
MKGFSPRARICFSLCLAAFTLLSCGRSGPEVVVYVSHDRVLSEPVLRKFEQLSGIRARAVYDIEANKTVGLTNRLIAERDAPRADVFWNNEVVQTIRLQSRGVLATEPISLDAVPSPLIADPSRAWIGFAARARVLLLNTERAGAAAGSQQLGLGDLARREWRGRVAVANPKFGTTGTHFAALLTAWGEPEFRHWLRALRDNEIAVLAGNAMVRDAVATGEIVLGLTDTDDAVGAVAEGKPVAIVFPDQQADSLGTLLIPNSVSIVAGAPHPGVARRLTQYLLSAEVEAELAHGRGAQLPINHRVAPPESLPALSAIRTMKVDFAAVTANYERMLSIVGEEWQHVSSQTAE